MHAPRARKLAILAVLATLAAAVQAQSTSGPRYGSKDDLRQCMDSNDRLKAEQPQLQQKLEKHRWTLKRFQDEMQAHVALQPGVDATDEKAVAAYNEQMEALNARVDVINREGEEQQAKLDAFNARMQAHNRNCAGMVYRITDIQAVNKERAAAAKAKAGKSL